MKKNIPYLITFSIGLIISAIYFYFFFYYQRYYALRVYNYDYTFCKESKKGPQGIMQINNSLNIPVRLSFDKFNLIMDSLSIQYPNKRKMVELILNKESTNDTSLSLTREMINRNDILYFEKIDTTLEEAFMKVSILELQPGPYFKSFVPEKEYDY